MSKSRTPLQVSPVFAKRLKEMQGKFYANGNPKSLRDITEAIANPEIFNDVEKKILEGKFINFDIFVKFDKRKK